MENPCIFDDSKSARCIGLKYGFAVSEKTGKKVYRDNATKKGGPFYCPYCFSPAIIRKCTEKEDHFAHKPRLSPVLNSKDQALHTECKNSICKYLSEKYPNGNWMVERAIEEIPKIGNKRIIPDISGRFGDKKGIPIAIEVQKSAYTPNKIREKTEQYYKLGIYVLWIIPLKNNLGDDVFRPRLFEKYLHAMYYGRVYYWTPTHPNQLLPVHYSYTSRYIEPTSFYDENGEEQCFGGYNLIYKTIKKPNYTGYIDIATDLIKIERPLFVNKKWSEELPACKIMMDSRKRWWSNNEKEEVIADMSNYSYQDDNEEFYDSYDSYE